MAFLRQRIRWSRNSYRCYLTALSQGWLWRQPFITQVTVLQILLTPISMGAAIWYGSRWISEGGWIAVAIVLGWAVAGRALQRPVAPDGEPREIVLAPLVAVTIAVIALPIKTWAALTMNKQGWLTRQEGQRVQGQAEIGVCSMLVRPGAERTAAGHRAGAGDRAPRTAGVRRDELPATGTSAGTTCVQPVAADQGPRPQRHAGPSCSAAAG